MENWDQYFSVFAQKYLSIYIGCNVQDVNTYLYDNGNKSFLISVSRMDGKAGKLDTVDSRGSK